MTNTLTSSETLPLRQQAIVPLAAFAATGDIDGLSKALESGLNAGLTVSETREVLVQLYAYAGFPRSLNALTLLMKVVEMRRANGIEDTAGDSPVRPIPKGDELLAAGTANQTKLIGSAVKGPLFEFAPAIDEYLKTHLFGDIFERDNLDWPSREIATVAILSSLSGVELQLQSHIRISMNVGITAGQLQEVSRVLTEQVGALAGQRALDAISQVTSDNKGR